ncbi:hypothetical protein HD806DRAFT_517885 [Xylariaceae sp. AK1471]|nr:hypothetical protein HD806DRAFT_517885 [Xylariaceae sp. AK1471]
MANPDFRARTSDDDNAKPPVSPWSCFPCRRRKIRCDRRYPCSHCLKGDLDCGFPVSGRTPTRRYDLPSFASKKEKQDDLLGRLRRLEGFVEKLGTEIEGDVQSGETSLRGSTQPLNPRWLIPGGGSQSERALGSEHNQMAITDLAHVTQELGTLVMRDNESIYVGNWLWGVICDEVKHIRQAVEISGHESESLEKRILNPSIQGVPFFWEPASGAAESLQPLPSQVSYIWQIFVENVDPFIKVLHVPTVTKAIRESKGKFNSMSRGMEALMFAISLAAVTSLRENEVEENFGDDRQALLARLRLGTEQALSRAGVLNTTDLNIVQAFIIYQEIVEQIDGQRATWTLTGLLLRVALGMGLHRDGSHFSNVSPFDAEIRRRVWYHICLLDSRVGDCQVFNVGVTENMFDTRQPSNLNDFDIMPEMTSLPPSRDEYTDSTLCILRCRIWHFGRGFRSSISIEPSANEASTDLRLHMLTKIRKSMAKDLRQYLKPRENPFHLLIQTLIALELTRYDHIMHVANNFKSAQTGDGSHKAFALAMASLAHIFRLATQPATAQWGWYLYSCVQWHTMSTMLVRLSTSPWGPMSEAAWVLAKKAFARQSEAMSRDPMKQPLPDLMASVAKHRDGQIQKLRMNPTCREELVRLGAVPVPVPTLRDFSDGREAFDTSAAEERLSLEIDVSTSQAGKSGTANSSSNQSLGVNEKIMDMWIDLTPSFIGTDESNDMFQTPQTAHLSDYVASKEDLEQYAELISASRDYEGLLPEGDSDTAKNDEGMGWLAWDSIFRAEGVP